LNVHPGDTTKGYNGLNTIPAAKAIIAGDQMLRSTLFIVDKDEDTGPVLLQSAGLPVEATLQSLAETDLLSAYRAVQQCLEESRIKNYTEFIERAPDSMKQAMDRVCAALQDELKVQGDWKIYPLGVSMVAQGRVALDDRQVFIDGKELPFYGLRMEEN
jgi:folate-dependent phosphoribosylglycinamide formyltransferase PurN